MADKVNWLGHEFHVCAPTDNWSKECGGVYIFSGLNAQGQWFPFYVGKCDCFCDRLTTHERWDEAARRGATHVHAMTVTDEAARVRLEAELIGGLNPPLNTMLRQ